jgi:hypothetical protein
VARSVVVLSAALLAASGCASKTYTSRLLDASGDGGQLGTITTSHFTARHDWTAAYRYDCSKRAGASGFGLDLHNGDDDSLSDQHEGFRVNGTKGKGTLSFHSAGEYYFDVISHCTWSLTMKEQG